jgi:hypothetical protein
MRSAALFLMIVSAAHGEILDRLALVVGHQTISELQLDEEIRVTAFVNDAPIKRGNEDRRTAADRLVEQLLVRREMDLSRYPLPGDGDVQAYYEAVLQSRSEGEHIGHSLAEYQLTPGILKQHLALQLTVLRFIEFRFRPDVDISDAEIANSYRTYVEHWKMSHPGQNPPSLESLEPTIRESLVQERTDRVLETWIEESRKQVNIVYLDPSLR